MITVKRLKVRRWTTMTAAIVSLAVTLLLWKGYQQRENAEADQFVQVATQSITADLTDDIEARMLGLYAMVGHEPAEKWGMDPNPERESYARRYLAHYGGCKAIVAVDASLKTIWVVTANGAGATDFDLNSALQAQKATFGAAQQRRDVLLGPSFHDPNGQTLMAIITPVYSHDELKGFISGIFDARAAFEDMVDDLPRIGHAIEVRDGGEQLYRSSVSVWGPAMRWEHQGTVQLPGSKLQLRVWPTPDSLAGDQRLSHELLMTGLFMSFLLTLTVHLAQQARGRARDLGAVNLELHKEIAERKRAEGSLRKLYGSLLDLQDQERRLLAQELHDTTAQNLFGISMKFGLLRKLVSEASSGAQALVLEGMELAESSLRELRTFFYTLHPPDLSEIGLIGTLDPYVKAFARRSGMSIRLDLSPDLERFPREMELALFRTLQEALYEIHRHSGARSGSIRIVEDESNLVMEIRGTTERTVEVQEECCPGIAAVRERLQQLGGTLETTSTEQSITVRATLPFAVTKSEQIAGANVCDESDSMKAVDSRIRQP